MKKILFILSCCILTSIYFPVSVFAKNDDESSTQVIVETTKLKVSVLNLSFSANFADPEILPKQQQLKSNLLALYDQYISNIIKYYQNINNLNDVIDTYYNNYDDYFLTNDDEAVAAVNEINGLIMDQRSLAMDVVNDPNKKSLQDSITSFSSVLTNYISSLELTNSTKINNLNTEIKDIKADIDWFVSLRTNNIITAAISSVSLIGLIGVGIFCGIAAAAAVTTGGATLPVLAATLPFLIGGVGATAGIITGSIGAKESGDKVAVMREKLEKKYSELTQVEQEAVKSEILSVQLKDIEKNLEFIKETAYKLEADNHNLELNVPEKIRQSGVINHENVKADMKNLSEKMKKLKIKADIGLKMLVAPATIQK